MKSLISLIALSLLMMAAVHGFSPLTAPKRTASPTTTRLYGLFDFKPFHGHGSGEHKQALDDQWAVQQEILAARRGHIDKSALKKKYANGAQGDLSSLGGGGGRNTGGAGRQDEMYVEDRPKASSKGGSKNMKFFWEK
jgi:hypothetical protein